jgi:hypothetical protein
MFLSSGDGPSVPPLIVAFILRPKLAPGALVPCGSSGGGERAAGRVEPVRGVEAQNG